MKFTAEQIAKLKTATSAEELIALVKAEGIDAPEEEIKAQFDAMHKEGEIADEGLDNVAGGGFGGDYNPPPPRSMWSISDARSAAANCISTDFAIFPLMTDTAILTFTSAETTAANVTVITKTESGQKTDKKNCGFSQT